jgi:hypothetical protein
MEAMLKLARVALFPFFPQAHHKRLAAGALRRILRIALSFQANQGTALTNRLARLAHVTVCIHSPYSAYRIRAASLAETARERASH